MSGRRGVRVRSRAAVAGLVALGVVASGSRAEVSAPAWRLEPDAFVHYTREVLEREDTLRPDPEREDGVDAVIGFHGHELDPERRGLRLGPTHVERLFEPFVFALPSRSAPGSRRRFDGALPPSWRLGTLAASGEVDVVGLDEEDGRVLLRLRGQVRLSGLGADPARAPLRWVSSAALTWSARFDLARGLMEDAEYRLLAVSTDGASARPAGAHEIDPRTQHYRIHARLRLARVWPYHGEGFQAQVDAAIGDGLDYLESRQQRDGSWHTSGALGHTALALLALVDGGRTEESASVRRGLDALLALEPWRPASERHTVYALGVSLMLLERLRTSPVELTLRRQGERPPLRPRRLLPREHAWAAEALRVLLACACVEHPAQGEPAVTGGRAHPRRWGYPRVPSGPPRPANAMDWDNSNSQYAVLGLESAARCGLPVPAGVWGEIAEHYLAVQAPDGRPGRPPVLLPAPRPGAPREGRGASVPTVARTREARSRGWAYGQAATSDAGDVQGATAYGSMTAAGLASLTIARARIEAGPVTERDLLRRIDEGLLDGWTALDGMFDVRSNPGYEGWTAYWLYGLERAGRLADVERVGRHDWYWEGALQLVLRRSRFGEPSPPHWRTDRDPVLSTAWAILFLKRGTLPVVTR